jgi:hypothetical protein
MIFIVMGRGMVSGFQHLVFLTAADGSLLRCIINMVGENRRRQFLMMQLLGSATLKDSGQ